MRLHLTALLIGAALLVGACAPAAAVQPCPTQAPVVQPTPIVLPAPSPKIVEVPGPERIVQVPGPEVEVTPEECLTALNWLLDFNSEVAQPMADIFDAYTEYPDENLGEFGRRVEAILSDTTFSPLPDDLDLIVAACRKAAPDGAQS